MEPTKQELTKKEQETTNEEQKVLSETVGELKPKKSAILREAMLRQLLKRRKEIEMANLLKQLSEKYPDLKKGIAHNQFGCVCLEANMLDKAEEHFKHAVELVSKYVQFSNVYMNIGNLHAQRRDYAKAVQAYNKVLEISPFNKELPCQQDFESLIYSPNINNFSAYVDAHTNLAVMYANTGEYQKGFDYCKKSLELSPETTDSQINYGDIMRQLGKKDEAIDYTWQKIVKYTQQHGNEQYQRNTWLTIDPNAKKIDKDGSQFINILSVKWGTRYGADYVNKLYSGIKRNTTWKFKFFCFTDDGKGLNPDIVVMPLEEGWTGWWGKVTLFKSYKEIQGRRFYIDLDMIITGSLDNIFQYCGPFGTLKTDELACQKQHKGGYNSSVMIWEGDCMQPVYDNLKSNFDNIKKFIVRFDFWLQMNVKNADFLQDIFPGEISDYVMECKEKVPENTRIVCFPRKPKPDEYPSEWIRQLWIQ